MPGETLMLVSGFMSAGWGAAVLLMLGGTLGTFSGSMFAYGLGWKFGESLVVKFGRPLHITRESLEKTRALTEKHETLYIIFSRFVPGVRHVVPYLCGIIRLHPKKYLLCNLMSSAIWCIFFISAGKLFGRQWRLFEGLVNRYTAAALVVLVFLYLVYKFGGKYRVLIYAVFFPSFGFAAIALLVTARRTHLFDAAVYAFLIQFARLRPVFAVLSVFNSLAVITLVAALCVLLLIRKPRYSFYALMIALNTAACFLLGFGVSSLFHRPRPEVAELFRVVRYGFPSVNVMLSVAFYGFLIRLIRKSQFRPAVKWAAGIFLSFVIAASGVSHIYLHTYYASDVLAGYSAGLTWLVLFSSVVHRLRPLDGPPQNLQKGGS